MDNGRHGIILRPNPEQEEELREYVAQFPADLREQITYIMMHDSRYNQGEHMTNEQIARNMGISRTTLWARVNTWHNNGSLDEAFELLEGWSRRQVAIAIFHAHAALPAVIENIKNIALNGTGRNALDASRLLIDIATKMPARIKPVDDDDANEAAEWLKRHTKDQA